MTDTSTTIKGGIGFGSALAIAISWHAHQSILWANQPRHTRVALRDLFRADAMSCAGDIA